MSKSQLLIKPTNEVQRVKRAILSKIQQYDSIIILRHVRPDPDAIGSQAALKELIHTWAPGKTVYLGGETEPSMTFLAEMDDIPDDVFPKSLIIVCDTANQARIDGERYIKGKEWIKIDHHPVVDDFGAISFVDETASSTCELIYELFLEAEKDGAVMTPEMARLLYAGIVADTGRFRFSNTRDQTFLAAARLVQEDFSKEELYNGMYATNLRLLRLEGFVLSEMTLSPEGAGYIYLTKEVLQKFNVSSQEASAIVNTFSTLEGLKSWVFFVEEEELIRVRLRSKGPAVHKLAENYNGGGHAMASGATVYSWEEADNLLEELKELCRTEST